MPKPLPQHADLVVESEETVWNGKFPLQRVRFRQRRFDGSMSGPRTWELWRRGRAGALLPYDPVADRVVLIEQWRLPALVAGLDPVMLEVPAGLCEAGEDPTQTIVREVREEAGLDVGRQHRIGDYVLSAGGCDERVSLYVGEVCAPVTDASGLAGSGGLASEHEDIRVRVQDAAAAIVEACEGRTPNSVTAIALLWLAARRDWLRRLWGAA